MFLRRRSSSNWLAVGLLALAYFVAGKAGLRLAFLEPSASPVWPPAGISLAALLVLGYGVWPALFVGAFLVNVTTAGNAGTALAIACGNTLEALCGAWLVNRYAGGTRVFERAQDVFKFALIAATSAATSPSIGLTSLAVAGFVPWTRYGRSWFTWWVGDVTGFLIIAPLVLLWWIGPRPKWTVRQRWEAGVLAPSLLLVAGAIFGDWFGPFAKDFPLFFLCGPIIIWTAFRFGPLETTTAILLLTGLALWGTLHHNGPFQQATDNLSLLTLQSWAGVLTLTAMTLAAAMSERRRAEAELEQQKDAVVKANRTKDNFLAMLSHELRTPLTPVMSFLDLLEAEPDQSETMRTALTAMRRNVELERRLIDDLLDLSRVAKGKLNLELNVIDAHAALRAAVEICRADAAQKRLTVKLDLQATETWVAADSAKFQQIFWNLLKNAVKFTPEGGEIVVASANREAGSLTISIRDNGIGIEPQAIGRVFNAFEQGEQPRAQGQGGLGLGLAISKAIAEGHGGSLEAASDGRGQGATFRLTIRTVERPAVPATRPERTSGPTGSSLRILLVDDHLDTCAALERLLVRRGHRVVTAHNVRSAVEVAGGEVFDLLISDMGLPDGTGVDLMTSLGRAGRVRGIAISGFGMNGDVEKSLGAGFSAHLTKPVTFEKLETAIAEAMGRNEG